MRDKGYKTGLFISPHLVEPRERIKINGKPISEEQFSNHFWEVYDKFNSTEVKEKEYAQIPPFFRFLTFMAFNVFLKEKIDVCIFEVGIGGR